MISITDDTLLVGTTELRTQIPKLTKALKENKKAILMKRGNPMAVIQDYNTFKEREELLETLEDLVFGTIAKERAKKATKKDFLNEEEFIKKIGLK